MDIAYKKLYRLGIIVYAVLFLLSILFYKERTIFVDIAYHLFLILKDGGLAIQDYRYGAAVSQVLPMLAAKLSMPMNVVMIVYSAGFVLYYFLCYLICGSLLKNYRMALVLLLYNTLLTAHTFYWVQSELLQGIAFLVVVFAYLETRATQKIKIHEAFLLLCCFAILHFFHALLFIAGLYMFGFFILDKKIPVNKKLLLGSLVWYILVLVIWMKFFVVQADSGKMDNAAKFKEMFPDYFTIRANKIFLKACITKLFWVPVTVFLVARHYRVQRNWLMFTFFLVSFTGCLLLINVSYPTGWEPAFYMEHFYVLLAVIIALPLVYDVLPSFKNADTSVMLIAAILVTAIVRIYVTHGIYTDRLNWEKDFLAKNINKKLVIDERKVPIDKLIMTWGTSFEFWLLSTTEYGKSASIIITDHLDQFEASAGLENKAMITVWQTWPYTKLPEKYFKFSDTVSAYTVIK